MWCPAQHVSYQHSLGNSPFSSTCHQYTLCSDTQPPVIQHTWRHFHFFCGLFFFSLSLVFCLFCFLTCSYKKKEELMSKPDTKDLPLFTILLTNTFIQTKTTVQSIFFPSLSLSLSPFLFVCVPSLPTCNVFYNLCVNGIHRTDCVVFSVFVFRLEDCIFVITQGIIECTYKCT